MKKINFSKLVIFEDADYLAINKPDGISTLEDRLEDTHLLSLAKDSFPDIQVCHRIDKDTSGVLVFAKNMPAYKHISLQFQEREINKIYHAVVHGQTDFDHEKIEVLLNVKNKGIVKWDSKKGKESITNFTTLQNFKAFSLIECNPITGRRHQIRVHLKHLSHPIVCDQKYEGNQIYLSQIKRNYRQSQSEERPLINRVALHSKSISFKSLENQDIFIEATYPKDFQVLLKQLNKYGQ